MTEPARAPTSPEALERLLAGWSAQGRPRLLQVAVYGRWEEAHAVDIPAVTGTVRSLVADAGPPDADVAVEFEWLGHPLVFVGARRGPDRAGEASAFEADVVRVAEEDPSDPRRALAGLAGGAPSGLEHVELGAANAWRSVGPLRLWTHGEEIVPDTTERRLRDHPALACCDVPVALEVAFERPRSCWLGVEVSEPAPTECTWSMPQPSRRCSGDCSPATLDNVGARVRPCEAGYGNRTRRLGCSATTCAVSAYVRCAQVL